jgi:hypothetical protein
MTAGLQQFGRIVRILVGQPGQPGRQWTDLRVNATVTKTDSKKPDKATIQIYNLNPDSRGFIQNDGNVILLFAGYGEPELIFQGDVDEATVARDGQDIVVEVEAGDGRRSYQDGALFQTFDPPLTSTTLLQRLANAMGVGIGNLPTDLPVINYVQGYTVVGPARDALDEITTSLGARWSLQDGELIITLAGQGLQQLAFLVTPDSGLVGTPEKTKKGLKFSMLLNGKVKPRRPVAIKSRDFDLFVIPKKVEHVLDTGFETDFYTNVEAVETGIPATTGANNG